ncbi:MAG: hypothetical protein WBP81_28495 [Solirubrobacteraceae bacterium]
MAEFPAPVEGIALTHFIVSEDVERSRRFYSDVLGGDTVRAGEPSYVALANSWIIVNVVAGPPTTSRRLHSKRRGTPIGSAASSTSGSRTSNPCTPSGARGGPSS